MLRITAAAPDGTRYVLAEFYDRTACDRACRNLRHGERVERLKAERTAMQEQRRQAREKFDRHARSPDLPAPPGPPEPPPDLTDADIVELTAVQPHELDRCCPLPEPKHPVRGPDPERVEKIAAKLIATTALAFEQNGIAKDVRVEVHE